MGSRAVVLVTRDGPATPGRGRSTPAPAARSSARDDDRDAARRRPRARSPAPGCGTSSTTDWLLLDCELLPWSAKAEGLLRDQYAATGAAARAALPPAVAGLEAAAGAWRRRRRPAGPHARPAGRRRRRSPRSTGATAGRPTGVDGRAARAVPGARLRGPHLGRPRPRLAPRRRRPAGRAGTRAASAPRGGWWSTPPTPRRREAGVEWWEELTAGGGEGMVVKPLANLTRTAKGLVQPGLKVRGREYLRLIYGPDYLRPDNLARLRDRNLEHKRSLALREYALGLESLERFVARRAAVARARGGLRRPRAGVRAGRPAAVGPVRRPSRGSRRRRGRSRRSWPGRSRRAAPRRRGPWASGRSRPSRAGARSFHIDSRSSKPGIALAARVLSGPADTRLERMPVGPEVAGQVAVGRLQRRLGHAHPVVRRPRDGRVEGHAHDRRAARHQRPAGHGQRLEGVRRDLDRLRHVGPRALEELAAQQRLGVAVGDRVHHAVEAVDVLAHRVGEPGQVVVVGHVELEHRRLGRQPLGDPPGDARARGRSWRSAPSRPAPARPAPPRSRSRSPSSRRRPGSACRRECPSSFSAPFRVRRRPGSRPR